MLQQLHRAPLTVRCSATGSRSTPRPDRPTPAPPAPAPCRQQQAQASRRGVLGWLPLLVGHVALGLWRGPPAAAKVVLPAPPAARNVEDARRVGDKRREELDRAKGPLKATPSGVRYRDLRGGVGDRVEPGNTCEVSYVIYTSNGLYVDSVGYGFETKSDQGEVVRLQLEPGKVPEAVCDAMVGMREGGKRRIMVKPERGWTSREMKPIPDNDTAKTRLYRYIDRGQALLFEVELVRVLHDPPAIVLPL